MEGQTEKRKSQRVTTHVPIKYRKLGDSEGTLRASTITKNISEGGVRFKAPEFISRACRLIIEMDMPMFTKPVKAISKVAWIRKTATENEYEMGNQFLEMSKHDKELISEYVKGLALYNDPAS
ncbi:MAG: PilZ domain-containing protein [Candidatus Omnitrophota bacterium]